MKLNKEIKVGIIVTVAIALFIYGINFLKGTDLFSHQRTFYAVYKNVSGLVQANPVNLNGFKVGIVKNIEVQPDAHGTIVVMFTVTEDNVQIPRNTIARVGSSGLLGSMEVQLLLGDSKTYAQDGDTLASEVQEDLKSVVDKQIAPLKQKAEGLISSIDSVMVVIQAVFNKDARDDLTQSFESIKNAIATFEKTSLRLDTLVASEKSKLSSIFSKVESITTTIANNNAKLSNALNNISNITDSLAKSNLTSTINNTNKTMADVSSVMEKINKGEGSIGLLVNDKKLYSQLDSSSAALNALLEDMKKYPGRYFSIFGKKDKPKKRKS